MGTSTHMEEMEVNFIIMGQMRYKMAVYQLMKFRPVQCRLAYLQKSPHSSVRLDALVKVVNKIIPKHMKELNRTEILGGNRVVTTRSTDGVYDSAAGSTNHSTILTQMPAISLTNR